ncbi:MAG TPA: hypothetical protein VKA27_05915 [Sunxiuqinia sp.]|nr:hypothetical protein [Sunxiuqinia sp.]
MKIKLTQFFAIFLAALFFVSCQKENTSKAPTIPPYETMVPGFGQFATQTKSVANQAASSSKANFLYSATSVGFWSSLIGTTFAVPIAAFKASFSQNPTKINDNTWEWTFTVDGFNGQYTARLVGEHLSANQIHWKMYISKTGTNAFSDFLWFEGTSDPNSTSGQWLLYQSPDHPDKAVQIDWEKATNDVGEIKYTYVRETDDQGNPLDPHGSYLIYGTQDSTFDTYVTTHHYSQQAQAFIDAFIEWNSTDYSGHVKSEDFFGDTDWHCWDSSGNDVDCSN